MVIDLIRGKNAEDAMTTLKFSPRNAARVIQKVLNSAVANAAQKEMGDLDALRILKAYVDVGPTMKRIRPRAMGRANTIRKRTSHITLVLGEDMGDASFSRSREKRGLQKPSGASPRSVRSEGKGV